MAAVLISSNSQVASNTIAGTDLSSGYKSTLKVHCPAGLLAAGDIRVGRLAVAW